MIDMQNPSIWIIVLVIWVHWLADFVLQSEQMAKNKSKSIGWLSYHIAVYSTVLLLFFGLKFALINGIAHFAVDAVTSKITAKLYSENKIHWFFVVVGFDQAAHLSILLLTVPSIILTFS